MISNQQSKINNQKFPLPHAQTALVLVEETARTHYPHERDFIRAHWLLGASLCVAKRLDEAEAHLSEALQRCRAINMVDHEAYILLDLARLRRAQGNEQDAEHLALEALMITERCGYVLQGADVHLFLASNPFPISEATASPIPPQARDRGRENTRMQTLEHARAALQLATCDGEPYVYRVAYDEAKALIQRLEGV